MESLNSIMQVDHVIRVREDGAIGHPQGVYAPEFSVGVDHDGQILDAHERDMIENVRSQGWELETGWSGQYHYSGPIMHASEYVGGALEAHIRETPGYWCVVVVETDDDHDEPAGWALAFREHIDAPPPTTGGPEISGQQWREWPGGNIVTNF